MKYILTIIFATLTLTVFSNEKQFERVEIKSADLILEGNNLTVKFTAEILWGSFNVHETLILTPVLINNDMRKELPNVVCNTHSRAKYYRRENRLSNNRAEQPVIVDQKKKSQHTSKIEYSVQVPFNSSIYDCELVVEKNNESCGKKAQLAAAFVNTIKSIAPTLPVLPIDEKQKVAQMPNNVDGTVLGLNYVDPKISQGRVFTENFSANIKFHKNRYNVDPYFMDNASELQMIDNMLRRITKSGLSELMKLEIIGSASPDGDANANLVLSEKRALSIKEYIVNKYSINPGVVLTTGVGNDWKGLTELVEMSDLYDKNEILRILSMPVWNAQTQVGRKSILMQHNGGDTFNWMVNTLFPKLRSIEFVVSYNVVGDAKNNIYEQFQADPKQLNEGELFFLANKLNPDSRLFREVYETMARLYPKNEIANTNAAIACMKAGDFGAAYTYIERIRNSSTGSDVVKIYDNSVKD